MPSIEEAWSLPIPAELTSRQGVSNQQVCTVYFLKINLRKIFRTLYILTTIVLIFVKKHFFDGATSYA